MGLSRQLSVAVAARVLLGARRRIQSYMRDRCLFSSSVKKLIKSRW